MSAYGNAYTPILEPLLARGSGGINPTMPVRKTMFGYIIFIEKFFQHMGLAQSLLAAFPYEIFTLGSSSSQSEKQHMASVLQCSQCTTAPSFHVWHMTKTPVQVVCIS